MPKHIIPRMGLIRTTLSRFYTRAVNYFFPLPPAYASARVQENMCCIGRIRTIREQRLQENGSRICPASVPSAQASDGSTNSLLRLSYMSTHQIPGFRNLNSVLRRGFIPHPKVSGVSTRIFINLTIIFYRVARTRRSMRYTLFCGRINSRLY